MVLTLAANVRAALLGQDVGTFFGVTGKRMTRRRLWLAYAAHTCGRLELDDGAVQAVTGGRASLLPAGITAVSGEFEAGDPVELVDLTGKVVGRGLVAFDSQEIPELLGHSTSELRDSHGNGYDKAVVHRDDLVLKSRPKQK